MGGVITRGSFHDSAPNPSTQKAKKNKKVDQEGRSFAWLWAWYVPLSIFHQRFSSEMIWCFRLSFALICRHTAFSWLIHPSCAKLSKWKWLKSHVIVSCLLLPESITSHLKACVKALLTMLPLSHRAIKNWLSQDGGPGSKILCRTVFQVSSPSS